MNNLNRGKILGKGMFGQTYLVNDDGNKYALKIQKVLEKDIKPSKKQAMKLNLWREIDFYKFIDKLSKNEQTYFMKMYKYEFHKCKHKYDRPFKIKKEHMKHFKPLDDSLWCMYTLLELKGQSLESYLIKNNLSNRMVYALIIQLCYIGNLMKSKGYTHNDLHSGNITIQESENPIITYKNKDYIIPVKLQISAIDYGEVIHKNYNDSKSFNEQPNVEYYMDVFYICWFIIIKQDKHIYDCQKKNKKLPWEKEEYFLYPVLNEFIKDIKLWNKIKDITTTKYPESVKYIEYFEKNNNIDKFIKVRKDRKKHYIAEWALFDMTEYFGIYHPEKFGKVFGWCSYHKSYLSKKEMLEIFSYKNTDELMGHCLKKLRLL